MNNLSLNKESWISVFIVCILLYNAPVTMIMVTYFAYIKQEINCEQYICFVILMVSIKLIEFLQTYIDKMKE